MKRRKTDTEALVADLEQFSENCKDINKRRESHEFRTRYDFKSEEWMFPEEARLAQCSVLTYGNDQGGGDGDPARSTSLRAADSKGASSASVTTTNQTETVKTDDKKKKKRRGKPQKKLTGNQREKRRRENQENGRDSDDSEPDWDKQRPSTPQTPILIRKCVMS